ncbi:hypothetical protein Pla100_54080 [Neorhodopirellula pilleata]|uniref:Uncharacterized protein n=1 Tax=Neorhodopirellula pilleata TaxID=2714738 RepID=A0A5C5ZUL0_9BACT|nr:hypothetical protein Pla100_54080 [Neorhodopirellula pilleata]
MILRVGFLTRDNRNIADFETFGWPHPYRHWLNWLPKKEFAYSLLNRLNVDQAAICELRNAHAVRYDQ